jgi:DNA invertase Pin-like site-specific DNA recombinase
MRTITYARVSTGRQAESGLSLDDQQQRMTAFCESRGWEIVAERIDAGRSGRSMSARSELAAALDALDAGEAEVLICAKFDRLARSIIDLSRIMARAEKHGWNLVVLDLDLDLSSPSGRMVAHIVGAVAQYESDLISERVTMAHQQMRKRGRRSGRRTEVDLETRQEILAARAQGQSYRAIAADLTEREVPTATGGRWHPSTVQYLERSIHIDLDLEQILADAAG